MTYCTDCGINLTEYDSVWCTGCNVWVCDSCHFLHRHHSDVDIYRKEQEDSIERLFTK